jgi:hypothetical protein
MKTSTTVLTALLMLGAASLAIAQAPQPLPKPEVEKAPIPPPDVKIETTGGHNPVLCHGHSKSDAIEMKKLIEQYQTEHYRTGKTN